MTKEYKVYVIKQRKGGSERIKGSYTRSQSKTVAEAAFWDCYSNGAYQDSNNLLLFTVNHQKIAVHRFLSQAGDENHIEKGQGFNYD